MEHSSGAGEGGMYGGAGSIYYATAPGGLTAPTRRGSFNRPGRSAGASAAKKHCNCKNSRCLKLYCECFASGRYCDSCNCVNCCNNRENESTRKAAVEAILERNPNAFRPKIQGGTTEDGVAAMANARHNKGCNCKKSGCLKKYCECFQAAIFCSDNCKCLDCKNYEGSQQREVLLRHAPPPVSAAAAPEAAPRSASPVAAGRSSARRAAASTERGRKAAAAAAAAPAAPAQAAPAPAGPAGGVAMLSHTAAVSAVPPSSLAQLASPPGVEGGGTQAGLMHMGGGGGGTLQAQPLHAGQHLPPPGVPGGLAGLGAQQMLLQAARGGGAARPVVREVVNEMVKKGGVENMCQLLLLVSAEAGEGAEGEPGAGGAGSAGGEVEPEAGGAGGGAGGADVEMLDATPAPGRATQAERAVGGGTGEPGPSSGGGTGSGRRSPSPTSAVYERQEGAVLREFALLLAKMAGAVEKKVAAGGGGGGGGGGLIALPQGAAYGAQQPLLVPLQQLTGGGLLAPVMGAGHGGGAQQVALPAMQGGGALQPQLLTLPATGGMLALQQGGGGPLQLVQLAMPQQQGGPPGQAPLLLVPQGGVAGGVSAPPAGMAQALGGGAGGGGDAVMAPAPEGEVGAAG